MNPTFPADQEEGDSPEVLAVDGVNAVPKEEQLPDPAVKVPGQEEDSKESSTEREGDIYAEAVLACSIENKEACVMCSG